MKRSIIFKDFCILCENEAVIDGRKGAAVNYKKIRIKIDAFTSGSPLRISDITPKWVTAFNDWLVSLRHEKSTIAFYNRSLRSIYNQAVKKKLVKNNHPFDVVTTSFPFPHTPVLVDVKDDHGKRIPLEQLSHEELIRNYKSLAYKYNDILNQLKRIMTV